MQPAYAKPRPFSSLQLHHLKSSDQQLTHLLTPLYGSPIMPTHTHPTPVSRGWTQEYICHERSAVVLAWAVLGRPYREGGRKGSYESSEGKSASSSPLACLSRLLASKRKCSGSKRTNPPYPMTPYENKQTLRLAGGRDGARRT